MDDNKLDDFLRNKLSKYPSPVPIDMWQRIQKKKDRKRFIWFWLMLLSPLFIAGVYFIFHKKNNTIHNTSAPYSIQNTDSLKTSFTVPIHPKTNDGGIYKKDSIATDQTGNKITNEADTKGISQSEVKHRSWGKTKYTFQKNSNKPIHQFEKEENTKAMDLVKEKAKIKGDSPTNSTGKFQISNDSDSSTNSEIVSMDKDVKPIDSSSNRVNKYSLPKDTSEKKKEIQLASIEKKDSANTHNARTWFLELFGSPDISFFERNSGNPLYYRREISKKNSYTAGVRAGRFLGKHLSLKIGLQYSRLTENFSFTVDSNHLANQYESLDIPLLVGCDLRPTFIKTTINAGIVYNLYTWYKGMDLVSTTDFGNITEIYKHNTGTSVYIGLNLSKKINNKLEVIAEPYYRYRLSYMTKPSVSFSQKINVAGISLGLKYNFKTGKGNSQK